jgi:hypothetical protein
LALEEVLGIEIELWLVEDHFGEVEGYHVKHSGDHGFQQIAYFEIVETLLDDVVGLDGGPGH